MPERKRTLDLVGPCAIIDSTSGCLTKNSRDRFRLFRGDDEIEIAHDFLAPPITPRNVRPGERRDARADRFRIVSASPAICPS